MGAGRGSKGLSSEEVSSIGIHVARIAVGLADEMVAEEAGPSPSSRGCLGCCTKATPIIAVDEPSKGLKIQGQTVKKPSISEDFWSTSTCEMDNSAVQSQRSVSSSSTSNQILDHHSGTGSQNNPSEFLNHGKS
ncbi:hypothetical protein HHK36_021457 [Tetracentron sinense]|uniref:Uncharacterized protein n=1 Tax=Tetracentron sinense TaxID=13715 RepID=A0A834YX03_TETSI|nr:hypothetical protein HHK36_021457 [Tetracentron sinense]